jgi:hypothetical protein
MLYQRLANFTSRDHTYFKERGNREQGAGEQGAGEQGAGSREQGAGSREMGRLGE